MSNCIECGVSLGRVKPATGLCNSCEGSPQKQRERKERADMGARLEAIESRLEALEARQVESKDAADG